MFGGVPVPPSVSDLLTDEAVEEYVESWHRTDKALDELGRELLKALHDRITGGHE
jgi:hypothetical protein